MDPQDRGGADREARPAGGDLAGAEADRGGAATRPDRVAWTRPGLRQIAPHTAAHKWYDR